MGYDKRIRALGECRLISNADRSLLGCYGVNGGKAGRNYQVSVLEGKGAETVHPGMTDSITVPAGAAVRIVTTGGGGWGDPLEREVERVVYDVECGLVSTEAAHADYGVVLLRCGRKWAADIEATRALRAERRAARGIPPMFDRGPYFEKLRREGRVRRPEGWSDPDDGWTACQN